MSPSAATVTDWAYPPVPRGRLDPAGATSAGRYRVTIVKPAVRTRDGVPAESVALTVTT